MAHTQDNPDVIWIDEPEMGFWEMTFLPAIVEGLKNGDTSGEQLGKWIPDFARGTGWVRKLAEAWYCGQFRVGKFIREYPHHVRPMTDILIGRIFHPGAGDIFDDLDP